MRNGLVCTVVALLVGSVVFACGTEAVGVDACRQIEHARCRQAAGCGIDLSKPVHRGSPGTDVDACIRFYDDACRHGMETNVEPGAVKVNACVAAIETGGCAVVASPETNDNCKFLIPPAAPPPAAPVVDAGDAG